MIDHLKMIPDMGDHSKEGNLTLALPFVWTVWKERNNRIFCRKVESTQPILMEILYQIRSRASYLRLKVSTDLAAAWNLPPDDTDDIPCYMNCMILCLGTSSSYRSKLVSQWEFWEGKVDGWCFLKWVLILYRMQLDEGASLKNPE